MGNNGQSHGDMNFKKQVGQSATIERHEVKNETVEIANAKLADLGREVNPVGEYAKYMGSVAVHAFWNETLEQVFFVSQAQGFKRAKCPEVLAQAAMTDLNGSVIESYGHKRPRLRSGF